MSNFYPVPTAPQRSNLRWILLGLHAFAFAGVVFGYPFLAEGIEAVLTANVIGLVLPIWNGLLIAHLLLTAWLETRESARYTRRERQRREEYERQRRETLRAKAGSIVNS